MPHLTMVSLALESNILDVPQALQSLDTISELATKLGDPSIVLLSGVLRLRALVLAERWPDVLPVLTSLENLLQLDFSETKTEAEGRAPGKEDQQLWSKSHISEVKPRSTAGKPG